LTRFLIGAGGWAYFQVPGLDPLVAYSKAFNFVEVNSTYYEIPNLRLVESWRRKVPPHFQFAVRCHRGLTHKYKLEPTEEAYRVLNEMTKICGTLRADILHMQTPLTLSFTKSKIDSIRGLLHSVDLRGIRIAWEVRQAKAEPLSPDLIKLMQDHNLIHCVDISREDPAFKSDTLYTRLFGKGFHNIYQFTDEELKEIDEKMTREDYETAALCFHGVKMYKDAARFKVYKQTGKFPMVTKSTDLSSLREVLSEDAKFPSTKQQLLLHQGWKMIDLTKTKRVLASEILEKLPEQTYRSAEEVVQTLRNTIGRASGSPSM